MRDVVFSCRTCIFSQVKVSLLAFMQDRSRLTRKPAAFGEAGNSLKTVCRLWFTAATNGRMSDLGLLLLLVLYPHLMALDTIYSRLFACALSF